MSIYNIIQGSKAASNDIYIQITSRGSDPYIIKLETIIIKGLTTDVLPKFYIKLGSTH